MTAERPEPAREAKGRRGEWRVLLTLGAPLLFVPPALALADRGAVLGVPTLILYVFAMWGVGIVLVALVERGGRRP